ncbi:glycosyltransferase family 2 protein [Solirubrobacter taibaiensis]|nr:glycosyltransferase family 2 protein [Solirubrobacter taibaiensis]
MAVIVPCFNAGRLILETIESLQEPEPLELIVVDDRSDDAETQQALAELEARGVRVIRGMENRGAAAARTTGLNETTAPFVFPLDADDLAIPGRISRAADLLEANPDAAAVIGDYEEFGNATIVRAVPDALDPYRIAFTNEYAITSLFRRSAVEQAGGWRDPLPEHRGYEDWNLWMDLAERGARVVHLHDVLYRRRLHAPGLDLQARRRHAEIYAALRRLHRPLFADLAAHRRRSPLSRPRKLLYPVLYGDRKLIGFVRWLKPLLDRAGVWTLRR